MTREDYHLHLAKVGHAMLHHLFRGLADGTLPPGVELYVTFATQAPGVELGESVRAEYPEEITVRISERALGAPLVVNEEGFSTRLHLGADTAVRVPFAAVIRVVDQAAGFGWTMPPGEERGAPVPSAKRDESGDDAGNVVPWRPRG